MQAKDASSNNELDMRLASAPDAMDKRKPLQQPSALEAKDPGAASRKSFVSPASKSVERRTLTSPETKGEGRLLGQRVLVTAAANGIGKACAELFAAAGADVFATDVDEAGLASLVGVETELLDCTDHAGMAAYVARHAPFDSVVHCVGVVSHGSVLDCSQEDWSRSFRVNVDSFYWLLRAVLPGMVDSGGGAITCIASVVSSIKGLPNRAAYGASKAALIGLIKSVAADFAKDNVRCNAVCPGTVLSPSLERRIRELAESVGCYDRAMEMFVERQPLGRLGRPEEVAGLCLYLAADEGRFVTGQALPVDGGLSI